MINSIIKIVEYILSIFSNRSKNTNIQQNTYNKNLQKEQEQHTKVINEAHKTGDLEKLRKEASE